MPHVAVVELHLQAHTTHISDLLVSHQNIDNICYRSIQADFPVTVLMTHPDCEYQPPKHMFHHLIAAVNLGFVARVVQRDFFFHFSSCFILVILQYIDRKAFFLKKWHTDLYDIYPTQLNGTSFIIFGTNLLH